MIKEIFFAGGCFWGTEQYLKLIAGVVATEVGFANGNLPNPTYEQVCRQNTGYAETVRVKYDPDVISLEKLVEIYFKSINPTSVNRQGNDIGSQYRTGIYYSDKTDFFAVKRVYDKVEIQVGQPLAVELKPIKNFYPAEEYHQDYLEKNPNGYCHISPELLRYAAEANK